MRFRPAQRQEGRWSGDAAPPRRAVIGLLGGIGSGKSTVARLFREAGAKVIDADAICRVLLRAPAVRRAIRAQWGGNVFRKDGFVNRQRLADVGFNRPEDVKALNDIMHPRVARIVRRRVGACGARLCVIDAPLLIESGLDGLCDFMVFVACNPSIRARRLAESRGWAPAEAARREKHQLPLAQKRRMADFVIVNDGDIASTSRQVSKILTTLSRYGV